MVTVQSPKAAVTESEEHLCAETAAPAKANRFYRPPTLIVPQALRESVIVFVSSLTTLKTALSTWRTSVLTAPRGIGNHTTSEMAVGDLGNNTCRSQIQEFQ